MTMTDNITSPLAEACDLTVRLSDLVARCVDETEEGESLRDVLHDVWIKLPKAERDLVQNLSADLDLIAGTETSLATDALRRAQTHSDPSQGVRLSNLRVRIKREFDRGEWNGVLQLVRQDPKIWSPSQLALIRAEVYRRMGLARAAAAFHQFGLSLDAKSWHHRVGLIQSLSDGLEVDELETEVAKVANDPESSAGVLIASATALCRLMMASTVGDTKVEYAERVIRLALMGLSRPRDMLTCDATNRATAHMMASVAMTAVGRVREAIEQLSSAISETPRDPALYELRGMLKFRINEPAVDDFSASVKCGAQNAVPYGVVASDAFGRQDFHKCLETAKAGLTRDPHRELKAVLLMYQAICQFELGGSSRGALRLFESSRALDPANEVIGRNFVIMEARAAQEGRRRTTDYLDTSAGITSTLEREPEELMLQRLPNDIFAASDRLAAMVG